MMAAAPSGVVTFLFTDVEGSTRRWEAIKLMAMRAALAAHDKVLRTAIEAHGGWLFKHTGDGVCAAFSSPKLVVDAAVLAQGALLVAGTDGAGNRRSRAAGRVNHLRRSAEPRGTGDGRRGMAVRSCSTARQRFWSVESISSTLGRDDYATSRGRWSCSSSEPMGCAPNSRL